MTDTKTDWSEMREQVNKAAGTFFITAFLVGLGFLLGNYYRADRDHSSTDRLQDQRIEKTYNASLELIRQNRQQLDSFANQSSDWIMAVEKRTDKLERLAGMESQR